MHDMERWLFIGQEHTWDSGFEQKETKITTGTEGNDGKDRPGSGENPMRSAEFIPRPVLRTSVRSGSTLGQTPHPAVRHLLHTHRVSCQFGKWMYAKPTSDMMRLRTEVRNTGRGLKSALRATAAAECGRCDSARGRRRASARTPDRRTGIQQPDEQFVVGPCPVRSAEFIPRPVLRTSVRSGSTLGQTPHPAVRHSLHTHRVSCQFGKWI